MANRHWSVDIIERDDHVEATINHIPTGQSRSFEYPSSLYEYVGRFALLGQWIAETLREVGVDDEYPGQYD
jgi:hypothetical protein